MAVTRTAALTAIKNKLATLSGVVSCKIGLEQAVSPADYPLIRILCPSRKRADDKRRSLDVLIYFGLAVDESDSDAETVALALMAMEESIEDLMYAIGGGFIVMFEETSEAEAVINGEVMNAFKMLVSRYTVKYMP